MKLLTDADREEIRTIFQEELKACLGRTIKVEKGPRKQGDPEKTIEIEEVDLVSWMIIYIPRIEAALRGLQEDIDRTVNTVEIQTKQVNAIGSLLMGLENSMQSIASLSDDIKKITANPIMELENVNKPKSNTK